MTKPSSDDAAETTLTQDLLYAARYYLGGRRGLLILAALVIVAGLALNWSWLVAAGIAPILLSVLPCLVMCALGLCMHRAGGKSCSPNAEKAEAEQSAALSETASVRRFAEDRSRAAIGSGQGPDHG